MEKYTIDYLKKEIMDGVSLDEISQKDIKWCAARWHLIMGHTQGGMFAEEVFADPQYYYGELMVRLEQRVETLGGKVKPMESMELR
jgi:hypothetical protein